MRDVVRRVTASLAMAGLVGALAVVGAGPAAAALAAPSATIGFGDHMLTLAWAKVSGATGYRVQYSTSSTMSAPVTVDAGTRSWLQVTGLTNDEQYYARVVAVAGSVQTAGRVLAAVPDSGYPRALTVTAVSAGKNSIRVSWSGQGRATKVGVIAAADSALTRQVFRSGWLPPTTTSLTLTVPTGFLSQLGTGSGNPVYVKVATYNSASAGTAMPTVRDEGAAYRLSLAGPSAQAGTVAPAGTRLRVAEWNVNSVGSTAGYAGYTWRDRRTKVAAGIARTGASVVATAELSTGDAGLGNGKRQWEDLRDLLAQTQYGGHAIANTVTPATTGGDPNSTVGAHLFYRPGVVTRVAGGFISPKKLLGSSWPTGLTDRYASWAKFTIRSTGAQFYAVAVHLPAKSEAASYLSLRAKEMAAIDTYVSSLAGTLPVLVMGDLNSEFGADPDGPQAVLLSRGYYDATATTARVNSYYGTVNISHQIDNLAVPGYPRTPYAYKYTAPRIDYIMVKRSPGSWKYVNQLVVADGLFDRAYQGSDHNLQWAEIGIR